MNHWLKSETLRRCLFPLAFVCIFIVWRLAEHGVRSVWVYLLLTVGVICLALDRVFKPWEHDRMRKRQERDRGLEDNSIKKTGVESVIQPEADAGVAIASASFILRQALFCLNSVPVIFPRFFLYAAEKSNFIFLSRLVIMSS